MSKNKCDMHYSDLECNIIMEQIARRARYRQEFLRLRTDPCLHSKESGYVFDEAIQRFQSLKATHFEYFKPNFKNALFGICSILPMFVYGYFIYQDRAEKERLYRCGEIKYRDRLFKFQ